MIHSLDFSSLFIICFACAVIHAFCAHLFLRKSRSLIGQGEQGSSLQMICELAGHHTSIFAFWLLPSFLWIGFQYGGDRVQDVLSSSDLTEPFANFTYIFLALSRTVRRIFISLVNNLSRLFGGAETAWWFSCLLAGVVLGGVISEPAVMVLVCSAMAHRYYATSPSSFFCYTTLAIILSTLTLGNLVVPLNINASLDLSSNWGWDFWVIASTLGWRSALASLAILGIGAAVLHKELSQMTPHHDEAEDENSTFALVGYLLAFIVAGLFEHIPYFLIAIVSLVCVLEHKKEGGGHADRLNLPLLIALFSYSMEIHAYLLSPAIADLYGQQGDNLPLLTLGLSALNEHLPGLAFISSLAGQGVTAQGYGLTMLALGSGLTLFASSMNVLASKLLRDHFPHDSISGVRILAYSIPVAVIGFLVIQLTYLLVP